MRFLSGLLGSVVGVVVSGITLLWAVSTIMWDDDFGAGFTIVLGIIALPFSLYWGDVCGRKTFDFLRRPDPEGKLRKKKWALRGSLYVALPLVTALMFYGWQHSDDPPSDASMLAHFAAHRAQFDDLADMAQHDKNVEGLYPDKVNYDVEHAGQVSPTRIAEYRTKLKAADVSQGFETEDKGEIDFFFWTDGSSVKNYAYLPEPPAFVLPTLDGLEPDSEGVSYYRHINGPWYLQYEVTGD